MSLVEYSLEGAVAVLTLNRPPMNALSAELITGLRAAIARAADPAVRAVVVTGSPHFAAGADIGELKASAAGEVGTTADAKATPAWHITGVLLDLERLPKPVIAAIRGVALGGGLELALCCDFRYLAEDARVGLPEIKLGIFPGAWGTQRLPRVVGLSRARELIYTGRHLKADEALAIGLADLVVPGERLAETAMERAQALARGATVAIGAAKRAINEGLSLGIEEGLALERDAFASCLGSADAREGLAAFLEKREAVFQGR